LFDFSSFSAFNARFGQWLASRTLSGHPPENEKLKTENLLSQILSVLIELVKREEAWALFAP
jgi:hypothetical protein